MLLFSILLLMVMWFFVMSFFGSVVMMVCSRRFFLVLVFFMSVRGWFCWRVRCFILMIVWFWMSMWSVLSLSVVFIGFWFW